jgi:hypothetical protein
LLAWLINEANSPASRGLAIRRGEAATLPDQLLHPVIRISPSAMR